jgi:hypothetical protein
MKKRNLILLVLALTVSFDEVARAATTINSTNKFAYGANVGWIDWRGDTNSGAVIGEYVCSGYIYSANVGWIHLGSGAPTNGIQYQNISGNDFGVNHDGAGNLRGFAYGANIGWINFDADGEAMVDLKTGRMSGSAYSANCGWISLSNAFALVQTDTISNGTDSDSDGMADAWERLNFSNLTTATAITDFDGDGVTDAAEYAADTDPKNALDYLRILSYGVTFNNNGFDTDILNWTSRPTRKYRINFRNALDGANPWLDTGLVVPASAGTNTTQGMLFGSPSVQKFFRVEAIRLLP